MILITGGYKTVVNNTEKVIKMDFQEMFERFEFLFEDSNDVRKDLILVEENLDTQIESGKYAELALKYIKDKISLMPPITLLTNLGLFSIGKSLKLFNYPRRINQFEIDYMMALVLKYGVMKMNYSMACGVEEIEHLLRAISIYFFCYEHRLHKDSIVAYKINLYYRLNRMGGFDEEKLNIVKEFCNEYDKRTSVNKIKLSKVIQFILAIEKKLAIRLEAIAGRVFYMEDQYGFFMFYPRDIKEICDENELDYSKVVGVISIFCYRVGELKEYEVGEMYLYNPINNKPVILIEPGILFLPNINAVFVNLFEIFEKIIEFDNQDRGIYSNVKTKYLEKKTADIISSKFKPIGKIHLNSQWNNTRNGENDCTLLYENYAIVFEDKSGKVNRNTHKGLLKNAYDDNEELIKGASKQATDFANLLIENLGKKLTLKVKGGGQNVIDLKRIKHVLNVGVVFEETILQNMSLGGEKHSPIVSIFQLNKIFQCLEATEIVDYFIKRSQVERNISYHADEYDFLYTYLKNGLNTSEKIYEKADEKEILFVPYTEEKPTRADLERENWFQVVLNSVIEQAEENWLDIIISMLGIPPIVQRQIIRDIFKEKKLKLVDNLKYRNKVVLIDLLDFFDGDTEKEVEEKIEKYPNFSEIIYIAFTEKFEHIIVKLKKC